MIVLKKQIPRSKKERCVEIRVAGTGARCLESGPGVALPAVKAAMSPLPHVFARLSLVFQRSWQFLVVSFCLVCAILPTNLAGPLGLFAVAEAEGESNIETEEACWGTTFRQLSKRLFAVPASVARSVQTATRTFSIQPTDRVPHRGEFNNRNGCGAPLLM